MSSRRKSQKVPFGAADVANLAKSNPYVARLIEDAKLRANLRTAADSSKRLYRRVSNGKVSPRSLLDDKKVQADVRKTVQSVRAVAEALTEAPRRRAKRARKAGRTMMIAVVGSGVALAGSEKLRSKVLDVLFGAEEEFEYTPPAATPSPAPAATTVADKAPTTEAPTSVQPTAASAPKSGGSTPGGSSSGSAA
jgi:hypothetical protein